MSVGSLSLRSAIAVLYEKRGIAPSSSKFRISSSGSSDAVITSLSENVFTNRLEKHLDDYQRGKGHLSLDVAADLLRKNRETSQMLTDPKSSSLYQAQLTGLTYNSRARFIQNVNLAVRSMQTIDPARAEQEAQEIAKALTGLEELPAATPEQSEPRDPLASIRDGSDASTQGAASNSSCE